jgi:hypothetical protein
MLLVSNAAIFTAPEVLPASTMYDDAAVGPVVGPPCHDTVTSEGIDELPCPVTDADALGGAGGAPEHVVPWASAVVAPNRKHKNAVATPTPRTLRTWGRKVIAVLRWMAVELLSLSSRVYNVKNVQVVQLQREKP